MEGTHTVRRYNVVTKSTDVKTTHAIKKKDIFQN